MAQFVRVPLAHIAPATLQSLLEEFASRAGTDYGLHELSLADKVAGLQRQLARGDLAVVYDLASVHWDLCTREQLARFGLSADLD